MCITDKGIYGKSMIISEKIKALARECDNELKDIYAHIDNTALHNTEKILDAFREEHISERHFYPTTGYGYNDDGRDAADRLFARCFGCEAGFVSHNIISGTHAIAIGLYALLKNGDTMLSVSGRPYDTLQSVIGLSGEENSIISGGVKYRELSLTSSGRLDIPAVIDALKSDKTISMVYVQRSKGYDSRRTLTALEINELYDAVKSVSDAYVFIDNNYGEFTAEFEPKGDLLAGSLIKNAGGGIAECGGYIVGSKKAVDLAAGRLTVPTVGREAGASMGMTKPIMKGLFFAPHTVASAMKTAHFAALLFQKLGFAVNPSPFELREDIIQVISLGTREKIIAFCKGIQGASPIDSFVDPTPGDMPGYDDEIIMAAGAFTQGSSIELSADAPLREPFQIYMQGGLTFESGKLGVMSAATEISR